MCSGIPIYWFTVRTNAGSKTLKYKELENEHQGPLATGKVLAAQTPSIAMCIDVLMYVVTCCVALKAASPRKPCRGPAALGGCQGTGHGLQPKRPKRRGFVRLGLRHRYKREYRERERHVSIYKII